jgi:hypothetical protein
MPQLHGQATSNAALSSQAPLKCKQSRNCTNVPPESNPSTAVGAVLVVCMLCLCSLTQQRLSPVQAKKQAAEAAEDVDLDMVALEAESDAVRRQQQHPGGIHHD